MNALTISPTPGHKPVVILAGLAGLAVGAKLSTPISQRLASTATAALSATRRALSPASLLRVLFGRRACMVAGGLMLAAIWAHGIAIEPVADAQRAVALDCLCALPWGVAALARAIKNANKEGGAL